MDESYIFRQILYKLDSLSQTVASQTAHIQALEKQVEELTTLAKGNIQEDKTNQAATKRIETMADRVAAMAAISTPPTSQANQMHEAQNNAAPSSGLQVSNPKKTSPHLVINLTECATSHSERPLKDILMHIQSLIKSTDRTKAIKI